jgi:putative membrane protein
MKTETKILTALVFLVFISLVSCKKDHNYQMPNQHFVTQASSSNMFEIAAGNLAMQKGVNADVKAFGNHMVTDHSTAATEMATLANQKGLTVPAAMTEKHQAKLNILAGLIGTEFDKQYASMMLTSHMETIALFQEASSDIGVPDDDLRSFAANKLPTLNEHLAQAQQLNTTVSQQ